MKIFVGADHRGFELKEKVKKWLNEWGYEYTDEGAYQLDPKDDYTTFASKVANRVSEDKNSLGVLICGSGVGVDVTANKFDGVRASLGKNAKQVGAGRHDDNMNILVIASDFTKDKEAKLMLEKFLKTEFSNEERYEKRLRDIEKIETVN